MGSAAASLAAIPDAEHIIKPLTKLSRNPLCTNRDATLLLILSIKNSPECNDSCLPQVWRTDRKLSIESANSSGKCPSARFRFRLRNGGYATAGNLPVLNLLNGKEPQKRTSGGQQSQ
jgi:hypothetical protein